MTTVGRLSCTNSSSTAPAVVEATMVVLNINYECNGCCVVEGAVHSELNCSERVGPMRLCDGTDRRADLFRVGSIRFLRSQRFKIALGLFVSAGQKMAVFCRFS